MPSGEHLLIRPIITSPLNGRKTTKRNSATEVVSQFSAVSQMSKVDGKNIPFTFAVPVPWPIRPSEAHTKSYRLIQSPIFWITYFAKFSMRYTRLYCISERKHTLLAYLALMLSSMACMLFLWKSWGVIWTRSAIFVYSHMLVLVWLHTFWARGYKQG